MSVITRDDWVRSVWRVGAALALVLGLLVPAWGASPLLAQGSLPETAAAAPEGTVLFQVFDLDREGAQWQQTGTLLARVGLPDALDLWEEGVLEEGAHKGDFTAADLDALLGGELAVAVTPLAIQRLVEHQERRHNRHDEAAEDSTPVAHAWDEPQGVTAILLPGDPDAAWGYVERQIADLAARHDVPVEEGTHGSGELLWIEMPDHRERLAETLEDAFGDAELDEVLSGLMGESSMHGRPGFAAGRAGDFIIAGVSQADVTEIIDVIDGATGSLAESTAAQQVATGLPAETLSFTYVDSAAILDAAGAHALEKLQAMMPESDEAMWQTYSGFAISAAEPGFRADAITVPGESGSLGAAGIANDPAVSAAAERVPAGSVFYQAGVIPENAFAGAAYMLALAVNSEMAGEEWDGDGLDQLPTQEEMEAEIATAAATLGFDPQADLVDLLGGEFFMFSSLPTFDMNGFGLDAVAAIGTSDPDALAETTRKIAALIDRAGAEADVSERELDGDTVYVVSDPETAEAPALEFGVVGDQAVVGTQGGVDALVTEPTSSLADDPQFQAVMGVLPGEFYQIAYVDIGQVIDALGALFGGTGEAQPTASPANIRALAAVSYQQGEAAGSSVILYIADPQS